MVRSTKQSATSVATPAFIPLENVVLDAPVKKPSTKKAKVVATGETPSTPVVTTLDVASLDVASLDVASLAVASSEIVDVVDLSVAAKMTDISATIQLVVSHLASLKAKYKALEKTVTRELKAAQKSSSRKSKRSGNRQPSGFVKPTKISEELATFLQKPLGTEMARTSVSKEINQYIRTNSLQDKANGRKINPDAKLTELLKLQPTDELTYFNLQRYMKGHFIKAEPVVALVAPVSSA